MIHLTHEPSGPVLLFDGECGLCQACVRGLLRLDRHGRLRFAPLQGAPAQAFLRMQGLPTEDFDTLVFVPEWRRRGEPGCYLVRTEGALAAAAQTGPWGRRLARLRIVPRVIRDGVYKLVARVRHRVLGRAVFRLPTRPEWRARFLEG